MNDCPLNGPCWLCSESTESVAKSRNTQIVWAVLIVLPAIACAVWWLQS